MCGITGFNFEDPGLLRSMMKSLSHRGPDDSGVFTDRNISLGHNRLSIIDLSKRARQPLSNEDGSIQVICNGEIYNFRELREGLEKRHKFSSSSDAEVIPHLYEDGGPDFVKKLRGMFAFALYDSNRKTLMLARDRVGIKPLYYHFSGREFLFASEIKALLCFRKFPLNRDALDEFFTFQYALAPRTLFGGIRMLLPSEYLILDLETLRLEARRYWSPSLDMVRLPEREYLKGIEKNLMESIGMRLTSDVPLGIYLSGGLDSSYMAALASQVHPDVRTFTIGFGHPTDEIRFGRMVAEHLGTEHKEIIAGQADLGILPRITWHLDTPVVDIAAIPLYIMSKETKRHLTVALMGDGGDEMLGGYDRYRAMMMRGIYRKIPSPMGKFAARIIGRTMSREARSRFLEMAKSDDINAFLSYISTFTPEEKKAIFSTGLSRYINPGRKAIEPFFSGPNLLQGMMLTDFNTQLPNDYLMKVDRMTMAHAIEARVPYLDHKFVEFAFSMPPEMKLRGLKTKYIFRKAVSRRLPGLIAKRRKSGFVLPTEKWMGEGLRDLALQLFDSAPKTLLKRHETARIIDNYERSRRYYTRQFWTLVSFILWYKMHFELEKPEFRLDRYV